MKAASKCKTDFRLLLEEPNEKDKDLDSWEFDADIESDYIEVSGVEVTLKLGKKIYTKTTTGGVAEFKNLSCGAYTIEAKQDGFEIDLGSTSVVVVKSTKPELALKIKRKLYLIEMYRIDQKLLKMEYGHWYLQMYKSIADVNKGGNSGYPSESYGWWPVQGAIGDSITQEVERLKKEYKAKETKLTADYHSGKIRKIEYEKKLKELQDYYNSLLPTEFDGKKTSVGDTFSGVKGVLNGYNPGGKSYSGSSPTTDPDQGVYDRDSPKLSDNFFPYVVGGKTAKEYKECIRKTAQGFSSNVTDEWNWLPKGYGWHCQTFQKYLMKECGLRKSITLRLLSTWTDTIE